MHKIESREISNRKYLSKTILACRERKASKKVTDKHFFEKVRISAKMSPYCTDL